MFRKIASIIAVVGMVVALIACQSAAAKDIPAAPAVQSLSPEQVLTVGEVAAYLRVNRATVWRWCQQAVIPATRVGRTWRIHRDDILDLFSPSDPESD